jgi:hypothetical protein
MLARAGFADVTVEEVPLVWRASAPDAIIDGLFHGTVRAAAALGRQSPDALASIKRYLRERISQFEENGSYAVPVAASVAAGRKTAK